MRWGHFLIFIFCAYTAPCPAQEDFGFPSSEENAYYNTLAKHKPFVPLDTVEILKFTVPHAKIYQDSDAYQPYDAFKYDFANSKANRGNIVINADTIAGVRKSSFLKFEKKGNIAVALYTSSKLEKNGRGLWVAYSKDSGTTWNYYYTGIAYKHPLYVKWYSGKPLLNDKGNIVVEACLLRRIVPFAALMIYAIGTDYECIKDGLAVELDLNLIMKDNDGDGLTDILEDKILTNRNKKDTDGDGIPDDKDMRPGINLPPTEKSRVLQAILNERIKWNKDRSKGVLQFVEEQDTSNSATPVVLIVTDDKNLMRIHLKDKRVVFMSTIAYQLNRNRYDTGLHQIKVSPLFKVDNITHSYKVSVDYGLWGYTLLVKKEGETWTVRYLSSYVV